MEKIYHVIRNYFISSSYVLTDMQIHHAYKPISLYRMPHNLCHIEYSVNGIPDIHWPQLQYNSMTIISFKSYILQQQDHFIRLQTVHVAFTSWIWEYYKGEMAIRDIWDDLCELRIPSSIWICIAKFFYWIKLPLWKKCILEFGVLISTNRISINVTDYIKSLDSAYYYSILLWHSVCTDRAAYLNLYWIFSWPIQIENNLD